MKISRFFPLLLLTLTCIGAAAQTTGLFTYDGGYFVKAGDYWTEYRPADKDGVWATYTQYGEETNYYQVSNSSCSLSIPKTSNNNFYIWEDGEWKVIYTTKHIYGYFNDESREIYAYNQGGYFVRDGNTWREYRPDKKTGIWATYTQYKEDDNYFYMRSSVSEVCVPKEGRNDFYLLNDGEWMKCYTTSAIYVTKTPAAGGNSTTSIDEESGYDYVFRYKSYSRVEYKEEESEYPLINFFLGGVTYREETEQIDLPAKVCISRNGKMMIELGGDCFYLTFAKIDKGLTDSYIEIYPYADNYDCKLAIYKTGNCQLSLDKAELGIGLWNLHGGDYESTYNEIFRLVDSYTFLK